ncbi:RNA-binding protein 28-like [Centruroides sculpturatus]|uniref:RNA-binding protein 28-like n=1 Tax=Centruroides sculpturatus TaxID=218467 RepID=UPI000C6E1F00|nr:RNA-binding protein 28-like [Centruroides sculpturatus]
MIDDDEKKKMRKKHKKGRLIIRNLSFKITEDTLKQKFSKFGNIIDIKIPTKPDGKMRGFAFVEFEKTASAIKAINGLNAKEILGRPVAIDFAVAKDRYQKLMSQKNQTHSNFNVEKEKTSSEEEESEEQSTKLVRKKRKLHERDLKNKSDSTDNEESEDESEDEDKSGNDSEDESSDDDESSVLKEEVEESPPKKKIKTVKPQRPNDAHEGKTLFIRNLSFDTTADSLKEAMSKFGEIKYCLLCIDKLTDYPKGTAFVQFINKEDAEKCLAEVMQPDKNIILDGRRLNVSLAISPEDIRKNKEEKQKKGKDNRNLKLLTEGLIRAGSDAAKGVSQADLKKRLELEAYKKRLLKNLHYFISPVRLCVHNLPSHVDDNKLKKIFLKAAGPQAKVISAKVMRNLKNLDEKGVGISKGFGFVGFTRHEDALQALRNLNNNPDIFTPNKNIILDGRRLNVSLAISPEDIRKNKEEKQKKGKDNRNLKLLTEGLIRAGSDAAKGVSQADLKKRLEFSSNKKESSTNLNINRIKVQKPSHSKEKTKMKKNKGKPKLHKQKLKKGKKNFKQAHMVY